jgi:hypothetical protein
MKILDEIAQGKFDRTQPTYSKRLAITCQPQSRSDHGKHSDFDEAFRRYTQGDVGRGFDFARVWSLALNCEQALSRRQGSVAELGVYKGHCGAMLSLYAEQYGRKMYLCDTFDGFPEAQYEEDMGEGKKAAFKDVSLASVKAVVGDYSGNRWVVGAFPESITEEMRDDRFAFVSIDCDIYEPIRAGLEFFWPRMDIGGMIFIHDYGSGYWPGATKAVDEFCAKRGVAGCLLSDLAGTYALARSAGHAPD